MGVRIRWNVIHRGSVWCSFRRPAHNSPRSLPHATPMNRLLLLPSLSASIGRTFPNKSVHVWSRNICHTGRERKWQIDRYKLFWIDGCESHGNIRVQLSHLLLMECCDKSLHRYSLNSFIESSSNAFPSWLSTSFNHFTVESVAVFFAGKIFLPASHFKIVLWKALMAVYEILNKWVQRPNKNVPTLTHYLGFAIVFFKKFFFPISNILYVWI